MNSLKSGFSTVPPAMVLSSDLFEGCETCHIWLRLPKGEICWLLEEVYFSDRLLNINLSSHVSLNCTLGSGSQQLSPFLSERLGVGLRPAVLQAIAFCATNINSPGYFVPYGLL